MSQCLARSLATYYVTKHETRRASGIIYHYTFLQLCQPCYFHSMIWPSIILSRGDVFHFLLSCEQMQVLCSRADKAKCIHFRFICLWNSKQNAINKYFNQRIIDMCFVFFKYRLINTNSLKNSQWFQNMTKKACMRLLIIHFITQILNIRQTIVR